MSYLRELGHTFFPLWIDPPASDLTVWWFAGGALVWGVATVTCWAGMYRTVPKWGPAHDR